MPTPEEELAALKTERDTMKAELEKLKAAPTKKDDPPPPKKEDDPSLADKARLEREAAEAEAGKSKATEAALRFDLGSADFLKNNAALLPPNIAGIFEAAKKENYGSAIEKASAIKVGIVSEFFALQENLDQLTASQKQVLEDFSKLTKNVKQERVQQIYESILEPTLESIRKIKKAQALQKGHAEPSDSEDAYMKRMKALSEKYHLGR